MRAPRLPRSLAPLAVGVTVWLVMPTQAMAKAVVRFVHAVPGVGRAEVSVTDGSGPHRIGAIGFGQATRWRAIRSGAFHWSLSGGGRTLATGTSTVGDGAYDLVIMERGSGSGVQIGVYRAHGGRPGTSLVRVIHAAPELGSPELMIDGKVAVKRLAYTQATPYVSLPPGVHRLGADRPGDPTPLVSGAMMTTRAGRSYTAVVIGTRGRRVRVIALPDRNGPSAPPTAAHPAPGAGASRTVVVRPGDSLWSIAQQLVGPAASDSAIERRLVSIWDANRLRIGTGDPNLIFPGTVLTV
jgi:hypothetical protein